VNSATRDPSIKSIQGLVFLPSDIFAARMNSLLNPDTDLLDGG
jgi:hypothetical protein